MGCRGSTGWLGVKGWEKDNVGDAFNGERWAGRAERLRFFHCARLLKCKHSSARSGMRSIFTPTTNLSVVSVVSDQTKFARLRKVIATRSPGQLSASEICASWSAAMADTIAKPSPAPGEWRLTSSR